MNKKFNYILIFSVICMLLITSCAITNKSMTAQVLDQPNNMKMVMYATYADALTFYKNLQDLYIPYQDLMKASNPDLHNEIIKKFTDANNLLKKWKEYGALNYEETESFREMIREVTLELAKAIDKELQ